MSRNDLEKLKNVNEAAKELQNVKDALTASTVSSDAYFDGQKKFLNKQISRNTFLLNFNIVRLLMCVGLCVSSGFAMFNHNHLLQTGNVILSAVIIFSFIITTSIEYLVARDEAADKEKEKNMLVDLYYYALILAERKNIVLNKVYADAYSIIEELIKNPDLKDEINMIKDEKGVDFDYLKKDIDWLENMEKSIDEQLQK